MYSSALWRPPIAPIDNSRRFFISADLCHAECSSAEGGYNGYKLKENECAGSAYVLSKTRACTYACVPIIYTHR